MWFERRLRTIIALLGVSILVPTIFVVWFMIKAVQNERLAINQRLEDLLASADQEIAAYWRQVLQVGQQVPESDPESSLFSQLVESPLIHSAIILDGSGGVAYPNEPQPLSLDLGDLWRSAQDAVLPEGDFSKAAGLYEQLAAESSDPNVKALAYQSQARMLAKSGDVSGALNVIETAVEQHELREARSAEGTFIVPNLLLYGVDLTPTDSRDEHGFRKSLGAIIKDYSLNMPSRQRLFLMNEMQDYLGGDYFQPYLEAELLAMRYLERTPIPEEKYALMPAEGSGLYQIRTGGTVLLFGGETLFGVLEEIADKTVGLKSARAVIISETSGKPLLVHSSSGIMKNYPIYLMSEDPVSFLHTADRMIVAHVWTGVLVVLAVAIASVLLVRTLMTEIQLSRLKNNLIATVSHELKTPLTSVRVLVETLLAERVPDPEQEREYLEMIARENLRLSRLIDNFLTFSRMERNKNAFTMRETSPQSIIDQALESLSDRLTHERCEVSVEIDSNPTFQGDEDALVTVLINLMDNALKYGEAPKKIWIRSKSSDGGLLLEVEDNGIGIPRRALRKVFDRFVQLDTSLSREVGGCGLGLSIVKFIVEGHGGTVDVESEPGKGSLFRVQLPVSTGGHG